MPKVASRVTPPPTFTWLLLLILARGSRPTSKAIAAGAGANSSDSVTSNVSRLVVAS